MRSKFFCAGVLALFIPFVAASASAQANYAAKDPQPRFAVGIGVSGNHMDWGDGTVYGGAVWVDWTPPFIPDLLHGLTIEGAYHGAGLHNTAQGETTSMLGGGLLYHARVPYLRRARKLQPFAKAELFYGWLNYHPYWAYNPEWNPETRMATELGGGLDYRLRRSITVRAEYDYQFWPEPLGRHGKQLNPQGITVGALYSFGGRGRR